MDELTCPFCGAAFGLPRLLHEHVVDEHQGTRVTHGTHKLHRRKVNFVGRDESYEVTCTVCWCGHDTRDDWIFGHWALHGGLHAHILEIALGEGK